MGEHEKTNPRVWVERSQVESSAEVWGQCGSRVEQKALPVQGGGLLLGGSILSPGEAKAGASAGALRGGVPVSPAASVLRVLSTVTFFQGSSL